jgi:serine/threonine protein kinase
VVTRSLSELGAGSFGRVYKARQLSTSQEVAIKILRLRPDDGVGDVRAQTDRFRREMHLCGELAHPNIVRVIDSGESEEGILYTVFEFVPGSTLKAVLAEEGRLGLRETVHLMGQVLDALSCAHARVSCIATRLENIMVSKTGVRRNALVLDFRVGWFGARREGLGAATHHRNAGMMARRVTPRRSSCVASHRRPVPDLYLVGPHLPRVPDR